MNQPDVKEEKRILETLVKQTDGSPTDAVQQIVTITSSILNAQSKKKLGDHCYYTACALLDTVVLSPPSKQAKLVAFVHELRSITITTPSGEALKHDNQIVWKDLPTFGYSIADHLGSYNWRNEYTPREMQEWENSISFFAQLDASTSDPDIDFTKTWALTSFSYAFDESEALSSRELAIRLACMWFIYDADKMWKNVPETDSYSLTTWQRRKRGLEEAREEFKDSDATTKLIADALVEIERVESQ